MWERHRLDATKRLLRSGAPAQVREGLILARALQDSSISALLRGSRTTADGELVLGTWLRTLPTPGRDLLAHELLAIARPPRWQALRASVRQLTLDTARPLEPVLLHTFPNLESLSLRQPGPLSLHALPRTVRTLTLRAMPVPDLGPISHLRALHLLDIPGGINLTPLAGRPLRALSLVRCGPLPHLRVLATLPALTALRLEGSEEALEIPPQTTLAALEALTIRGRWSRLPAMPALETLSAQHTGGERRPGIDSLRVSTGLRTAHIQGLHLPDLGAFSPCTALSSLELSEVRLGALDGMPRARGLTSLTISGSLATTRGISALSALRALTLADNPDLQDLDTLPELRRLRTLSLVRCTLPDLSALQRSTVEGLTLDRCVGKADLSGLRGSCLRALRHPETRVTGLDNAWRSSPRRGAPLDAMLSTPSASPVALTAAQRAALLSGTPDGLARSLTLLADAAPDALDAARDLLRSSRPTRGRRRAWADLLAVGLGPGTLAAVSLDGTALPGPLDLAVLARHPTLQDVRLRNVSAAQDYGPLQGLSLRRLAVSGASAPLLPALAGMVSLEALSLPELRTTPDLPLLPALRHLGLRGAAALPPPSHTPALEGLDLRGAVVTDLSALAGLVRLAHLDLRQCVATDLSVLGQLPALQSIGLSVLPEDLSVLERVAQIWLPRGGAALKAQLPPRLRTRSRCSRSTTAPLPALVAPAVPDPLGQP